METVYHPVISTRQHYNMTFGIFNTLLSVNRPNRNQYISTYKQYKFKTDSVYYGLYSKLNYNKTEMHAAKTLLHTTQH